MSKGTLYPKFVATEKAKIAARAESQLNVFASIQAILEGGTIDGCGSANRTKARIITLCHVEQSRQLAIYDKALDRQEQS